MLIQGVEYCDPFKEKETDKTYWLEPIGKAVGEHFFSFDLEKVYNLFSDYPWALSKEEKEIFDKENPYWKDFFEDRVYLFFLIFEIIKFCYIIFSLLVKKLFIYLQ